MSLIYRVEAEVTGQSQGLTGPAGTTGIVTAGAAFTLPAAALETAFTLNSTLNVLEDGQALYGMLPEGVTAKVRRGGNQYFIRSLFRQPTAIVYSSATKIFVNGDFTKVAIAADVTLSATVPTAITIEPNLLAVGGTLLATIAAYPGTITRSATEILFTPSVYPPAPVPLVAWVDAVVIGATVGVNPLSVGKSTLTEKDGILNISTPLQVEAGGKYFTIPTSSGFVHAIVNETTNDIYFGIRSSNGGLVFTKIDSNFALGEDVGVQINTDNGFALELKNQFDQIVAGLKPDGTMLAQGFGIGDAAISRALDDRYMASFTNEITKDVCLGIRKSGVTEIASLAVGGITESHESSSVIHFLGETGQSNSTGADGSIYLDADQPHSNLMLADTLASYSTLGDNLNFQPLTAPIRPLNGGVAYPDNIAGQCASISCANEGSALYGKAHQTYVASTGQGGTGIDVWRKGGTGNAYAKLIFELQAAIMIAARTGRKLVIDGILLVAGENDNNNANYERDIIQLGLDLQELARIAGLSQIVRVFSFQQHCFAPNGSTPALSTKAELEAHRKSPYHVLVGPRYQYGYVPPGGGPSGVHHDSWSYRRLGIKARQVMHLSNVCGVKWQGCRVKAITHNKTTGVIKVDLYVPFGPLRFDADCPPPAQLQGGVANYWIKGQGFETDGHTLNSGNPVTISGNSILIQIPPGFDVAGNRLRYAMSCNQTGGYVWGDRSAGRCGSVCDSDMHRGYDMEVLTCNVANGSANITGAFPNRGQYDRVTGASLAKPAIVKARTSDTALVLSKPWTGATGIAKLTFWHDQSNYLSAFDLPIPYLD
jgi:hypothetical protein